MKIRLSTRLQRNDPRLSVYVVIPGSKLKAWALAGTTVMRARRAAAVVANLRGRAVRSTY
jgi:hypothetical protein